MFFMHRVAIRIYNILTYKKKKKNTKIPKLEEQPVSEPRNLFLLYEPWILDVRERERERERFEELEYLGGKSC